MSQRKAGGSSLELPVGLEQYLSRSVLGVIRSLGVASLHIIEGSDTQPTRTVRALAHNVASLIEPEPPESATAVSETYDGIRAALFVAQSSGVDTHTASRAVATLAKRSIFIGPDSLLSELNAGEITTGLGTIDDPPSAAKSLLTCIETKRRQAGKEPSDFFRGGYLTGILAVDKLIASEQARGSKAPSANDLYPSIDEAIGRWRARANSETPDEKDARIATSINRYTELTGAIDDYHLVVAHEMYNDYGYESAEDLLTGIRFALQIIAWLGLSGNPVFRPQEIMARYASSKEFFIWLQGITCAFAASSEKAEELCGSINRRSPSDKIRFGLLSTLAYFDYTQDRSREAAQKTNQAIGCLAPLLTTNYQTPARHKQHP